MSLVACRFNPSHKMKASRREIHEQKCPDRFRCQIKYKRCPYDPLELIEEKDYEAHLLVCKSRPKITVEEQAAIERAKELNDIATEKEQIKYAREKYYKGCVEEPDIPGISNKSKKNNKKKQNKKLKKQFEPMAKKEEDHFAAVVDKGQDSEDDDNHNLSQLSADNHFDLDTKQEGEKKEEKEINTNSEKSTKENTDGKKNDKINDNKNIKSDNNNNKSDRNNKNKSDNKNNKKDEDKKKENNQKKVRMFYRYDPNEEDKDIGKFSANVVVPDAIYQILRGDD